MVSKSDITRYSKLISHNNNLKKSYARIKLNCTYILSHFKTFRLIHWLSEEISTEERNLAETATLSLSMINVKKTAV